MQLHYDHTTDIIIIEHQGSVQIPSIKGKKILPKNQRHLEKLKTQGKYYDTQSTIDEFPETTPITRKDAEKLIKNQINQILIPDQLAQ